MSDPRTRRGPRPLPEQQPGTSPPSSTPANRRRTRIEQLGRGGGGGAVVNSAPPRRARGPLVPSPGASSRPAQPARQARGWGPLHPRPLRAARSAALQGRHPAPEPPERPTAAGCSGGRFPRLRPRAAAGPPPGRPPGGPAQTPARSGLAPPQPLVLAPFIEAP